jgi:hypothetical protein
MRGRFCIGLGIGCALLGLVAGCNHVNRSALMPGPYAGREGVLGRDVVNGGYGAAEESPIPAEARAQHKPTRRAGTWSEEAADIEASLGVPR